jgi:hypothetical protein
MGEKKPKIQYVSPYQTEFLENYVIQFTDNRENEIAIREKMAAKRPSTEMWKLTPYFQTRSRNLVNKLFLINDGHEFVDTLIKASGVTLSGYFLYRDVIDIVNSKQKTLAFNENDEKVLGFIVKSLELNHVIAPKIAAIYRIMNGVADDEN